MSRLIRMLRPAIAAAGAVLLTGLAGGAAQAVPVHEAIASSGSTWAALAMQEWGTETTKLGLHVDYTPSGSAVGRKDFAAGNVDFALSDIGYQCPDNQCTLVQDKGDDSSRPYAYLPLAGGGTAFPYNLTVAGKQVTNLRLSGETIAKIFTNKITNWSDQQIQKDNNLSKPFPSIPIIPVVHSEGAGTTAMFTRYLAKMYPGLWGPFNGGSATMTEYWQRQGAQVAQYGSDGVMNLVASSAGNGSIGYNEYAYAVQAGMPVAKVRNAAGYYTLPTQYNDAVALTKAVINRDKNSVDYLLQDLDGVYTNPDPRSYALSSYSYGVIPVQAGDRRMGNTAGKWQTLADYLTHAICDGQDKIGVLGYSALPLNLVQPGFDQIGRFKAADSRVELSTTPPADCHNPTFDPAHPTLNKLAEIAKYPSACDKEGAGPCTIDVTVIDQNDPGSGTKDPGGTNPGGNNPGGTNPGGNNPGGTNPGGNNPGNKPSGNKPGANNPTTGTHGNTNTVPVQTGDATNTTTNPSANGNGATQVDPLTGQTVQAADDQSVTSGAVPAASELAAGQRATDPLPYAVVAIVLLVLVILAPPLTVRYLRRGAT